MDSEYSSYLALSELLTVQRPRSDEHDEMLFIVAHQVHELWFKQLLHEFAGLQRRLAADDTRGSLDTLRRSLRILNVVVSPINVLQTLTPHQFSGFRAKLGTGSGFQSAQWREIEAVLGRRDARMYNYFRRGGGERARVEAAMARPSVFDSLLGHLARAGYTIPAALLGRRHTDPVEPSEQLRDELLRVYLDGGASAQICERLVEIDQGVMEWRYRHVSMVERIIGAKPGTGGSSGASYLHTTLFRPLFPDLWSVRSEL